MNKNIFSTFSNTDNFFFKFSIFLLIAFAFSLFFNLDVITLGQEEPRRALVALEMIFNNNYIVTTLFDETFYDHPPLWNIVLAYSAELFGYSTEFAFRFPSALSLLLTGLLVFFVTKKYVNIRVGVLSAFYYMVSVDLYFFFSATAEIDIFFSLLIFLSILSVFHFYEKKKYILLFVFTYLFGVLGFFTKGVAALAFVGITLSVFFLYKKDFKRLFSLAHIGTAIISLAIIALYFYWYNQYEDVTAFIEKMWGLTSNRSITSDKFGSLFVHIFFFPANLLANLFPATLFLLFAFDKKMVTKIKNNKYILFLLIAFAANFIIYLISPGARARYTYMFYPMVISILVYLYSLKIDIKNWKHKTFFGIISGIIVLVSIACFVIPFVAFFDRIPYLKYTTPFFGILFIALFISTQKTTNSWNKNLLVICFFIFTRILYTVVAYPLKAELASGAERKQHAKEIFKITKNQPIYLLSQDPMNVFIDTPFRFYETGIYLQMHQKQLLEKKATLSDKGYYIANVLCFENQKKLYQFTIQGVDLALIKKE